MECLEIKNGYICIGNNRFNCPHCNKEYTDPKEFFTKRINRNKKGITKVNCENCCQKLLVTVNFMNDLVSFK